MWWGRRRKHGARLPGHRLSRQLSLGLLEDAMARAERQQEEEEAEPGPVPYPPAGAPAPAPAGPPARPAMQDEDVPVDNSAGPDPKTAGADDASQRYQRLPARCRGNSTRHGSFG